MAGVVKERKRRGLSDAGVPIPVVPGQGELFEGLPAEAMTVTAAAPDPVESVSAVSPLDTPPAGQDLLPVAFQFSSLGHSRPTVGASTHSRSSGGSGYAPEASAPSSSSPIV